MKGLRIMIFDTTAGLRTGGTELLAERPLDSAGWIWVDLDGADKAQERELLVSTFGIWPIAIQDAQRDRHPPKQELFHNCLFLLLRELHGADADHDEYSYNHLSLFVGENFLVTRRGQASESIDGVWKTTACLALPGCYRLHSASPRRPRHLI